MLTTNAIVSLLSVILKRSNKVRTKPKLVLFRGLIEIFRRRSSSWAFVVKTMLQLLLNNLAFTSNIPGTSLFYEMKISPTTFILPTCDSNQFLETGEESSIVFLDMIFGF